MIPYIQTKNGVKYLCANNLKSIKYFEFPNTELAYNDIPTTKNANDESIIDVSAFYKDFKDCIFKIAESAIKRIMENDL